MMFPTDYSKILALIDKVDPIRYTKTRNYKDGAITRLSPYISRGVISTRQIYEALRDKGYSFYEMEHFLQELAWREYWQLKWRQLGVAIDEDLLAPQEGVVSKDALSAIVFGETTIEAIDEGIEGLYNTGYMHNHMRMYVAALSVNIGRVHWLNSARWMYYHLLDGDWASNALSWQWVAGTNSKKRYYANQENINKFFDSTQAKTYLDCSYDELKTLSVPNVLQKHQPFSLKTALPYCEEELELDSSLPLYVYNYYNLDPKWGEDIVTNRVLLLEPSVFERYPIGDKPLKFALDLSQCIDGLQVFVGSFEELKVLAKGVVIHYKEHPLNSHYVGKEHPRDWLFEVTVPFTSFFNYWKKAKKGFNG